MPGSFESLRWNACVHRLDPVYTLFWKSFGGMESKPMLFPRGKCPPPDAQSRIKPVMLHHTDNETSTLPTELFWPQKDGDFGMREQFLEEEEQKLLSRETTVTFEKREDRNFWEERGQKLLWRDRAVTECLVFASLSVCLHLELFLVWICLDNFVCTILRQELQDKLAIPDPQHTDMIFTVSITWSLFFKHSEALGQGLIFQPSLSNLLYKLTWPARVWLLTSCSFFFFFVPILVLWGLSRNDWSICSFTQDVYGYNISCEQSIKLSLPTQQA